MFVMGIPLKIMEEDDGTAPAECTMGALMEKAGELFGPGKPKAASGFAVKLAPNRTLYVPPLFAIKLFSEEQDPNRAAKVLSVPFACKKLLLGISPVAASLLEGLLAEFFAKNKGIGMWDKIGPNVCAFAKM